MAANFIPNVACLFSLTFLAVVWSKKSFTAINYEVGFKFLKAVNKPFENVLFSPTTLTSLYGMVYAVSREQLQSEINNMVFNGWTENEIYDAMRAYTGSINRLNAGPNVRVTSANKIYYQAGADVANGAAQSSSSLMGFLPSRDLNNLMTTSFNSSVERVDFVDKSEYARMLINQWMFDRSQDKIGNLFASKELNDAVITLASGAVVDGVFTYGFSPKESNQRLFYQNAHTAYVYSAMTQTCSRLFYCETASAIAVGLPYGAREQVVMFFIRTKTEHGIGDLEQKIVSDNHLTDILDSCVDYSKVVTVTIPKFKLNLDPYNVRNAFMTMGTTTMFANGFANFQKIAPGNLYVTHAAHKAYFETKEGTGRLCPNDLDDGLDKVEVVFNTPFIIAAVEKSTRNLLLYGRVLSLD